MEEKKDRLSVMTRLNNIVLLLRQAASTKGICSTYIDNHFEIKYRQYSVKEHLERWVEMGNKPAEGKQDYEILGAIFDEVDLVLGIEKLCKFAFKGDWYLVYTDILQYFMKLKNEDIELIIRD